MERELSGPPRCGQKAEEPGNERGAPRAGKWSPEAIKSRVGESEAGKE